MNLVELRNKMNERKPAFIRQDFHKKRLRKRWVCPRGLHSKVKLRKAGHPRRVSIGYGSPKEARALSREGLVVRLITNQDNLKSINKGKEGIIIASTVGMKNKIAILKKAKEMGIMVLNLNVDEYLKLKEGEIKKRMEKKKEKTEKKKKEEEKKDDKKDKLEEKLTDEEKKELEKREKDRLLTKREI